MPKIGKEEKKSIIISIANHKGGTGKTTFSVGLLAALMNPTRKILLLDMDPQGNATGWLHKHVFDGMRNMGNIVRHVLTKDFSSGEGAEEFLSVVNGITQATTYGPEIGSYWIIPATLDLAIAEAEMSGRGDTSSNRVVDAIKMISSYYDITIIDTAPQLGKLTFSAIAASDYLILVTTPESMAVGGARSIKNYIFPDVKKYYNRNIELVGVVLNQWTKTRLTNETIPNINQFFPNLLFETHIKRCQGIMEMPTRGDFFHYLKGGKHTEDSTLGEFKEIAKELMERINKSQQQRKS